MHDETRAIIKALEDADLERSLAELIKDWPDADEELKTRVVKRVCAMRDDFMKLVKVVDDPHQLPACLANFYIELKTHWVSFNTQYNYQMFKTGTTEAYPVLMGASTSHLIGVVEPLLDPGDAERIVDYISDPLNRAA